MADSTPPGSNATSPPQSALSSILTLIRNLNLNLNLNMDLDAYTHAGLGFGLPSTTPIPRTLISLLLRALRVLIRIGLMVDIETWNSLPDALNAAWNAENEVLMDLLELCLLIAMQVLLGFLASRRDYGPRLGLQAIMGIRGDEPEDGHDDLESVRGSEIAALFELEENNTVAESHCAPKNESGDDHEHGSVSEPLFSDHEPGPEQEAFTENESLSEHQSLPDPDQQVESKVSSDAEFLSVSDGSRSDDEPVSDESNDHEASEHASSIPEHTAPEQDFPNGNQHVVGHEIIIPRETISVGDALISRQSTFAFGDSEGGAASDQESVSELEHFTENGTASQKESPSSPKFSSDNDHQHEAQLGEDEDQGLENGSSLKFKPQPSQSTVHVLNTYEASSWQLAPQRNECLALTTALVRPLSWFLSPPPAYSSPPWSPSASQPPAPFPLSHLPQEVLNLPFLQALKTTGSVREACDLLHGDTLNLSTENLRHVAVPKPSDLPPGLGLKEPVTVDAFERKFLGKELGYGLVAKKDISAGEIIIVDQVLPVWWRQEKPGKAQKILGDVLEEKARKLGPKWYAECARLAGPQIDPSRPGAIGKIWEKHRYPTSWEGKNVAILGPSLASLNHCCVPNCSLRLTSMRSTNENGEICWEQKPKLTHAIIRACRNIRKGSELSIAYMQTEGTVDMRQYQMKRRFGFECKCQPCMNPLPVVEDIMFKYHRLQNVLTDPNNIADRPTVALQVAFNLIAQLDYIGMHDARLIDLWKKCALITAHHSDMARACCFLQHAREHCLVLEGITGSELREIDNWYENPGIMPGFGGTTRGLSSPGDGSSMWKDGIIPNKALFILGVNADEYVRMSRYRPSSEIETGPTYAGDQAFTIVDEPDPKPPKLNLKAKNQFDMCRVPSGEGTCQIGKLLEYLERERRAYLREASAGCKNLYRDMLDLKPLWDPADAPKSEADQNDPESKSVGSVEYGSKQDNELDSHRSKSVGDLDGEDQDAAKGDKKSKKKKSKKKSKKGQPETPMIQEVGAEKKPNIVEMEDFVFCDAGIQDGLV